MQITRRRQTWYFLSSHYSSSWTCHTATRWTRESESNLLNLNLNVAALSTTALLMCDMTHINQPVVFCFWRIIWNSKSNNKKQQQQSDTRVITTSHMDATKCIRFEFLWNSISLNWFDLSSPGRYWQIESDSMKICRLKRRISFCFGKKNSDEKMRLLRNIFAEMGFSTVFFCCCLNSQVFILFSIRSSHFWIHSIRHFVIVFSGNGSLLYVRAKKKHHIKTAIPVEISFISSEELKFRPLVPKIRPFHNHLFFLSLVLQSIECI